MVKLRSNPSLFPLNTVMSASFPEKSLSNDLIFGVLVKPKILKNF
jgi:hypothetical protein